MENGMSLVEVTIVPITYNEEKGESNIALIEVEEGKYILPTSLLEDTETSVEAAKRIVDTQVAKPLKNEEQEEQAVILEKSAIYEIGVLGEAFTEPARKETRTIAIMHTVQLLDNLTETIEGCKLFKMYSEESRVILTTDDETIVLYRDGRATGDSELLYDHYKMVTTIA